MTPVTKVRAQLLLPQGAFKTKAARSLVVDLLFHAEQLEAENARLKAVVDEAFQMLGTADLWPADMIVTVKRAMEIIADQRSNR